MKYVIYIDYKTASEKSYDYKVMTANNITDAIIEADAQYTDEMYLIQIMKKVGKTTTENGIKCELYEAILCERESRRWHKNNAENSEREHKVNRYIGYHSEWYNIA